MQCLLLSVCPASKLLDYTNIFARSRRNENSRESVRCPLQLYLYLKQRLKQNNCWQGFGQYMICWAFRHKYCLQPNAIFFFRSNNSYLALTTIKKFNIIILLELTFWLNAIFYKCVNNHSDYFVALSCYYF